MAHVRDERHCSEERCVRLGKDDAHRLGIHGPSIASVVRIGDDDGQDNHEHDDDDVDDDADGDDDDD
eukprot:4707923-Pyramimonas_sp.AAC.1